jgi:hypothetical protein
MFFLKKMSTKLRTYFLILFCCLSLFSIPIYADFVNGNFEALYPSTDPVNPITGWIITGYLFQGASVNPPTNITELNLGASSPSAPNGISDVFVAATPQSLFDYFLAGASPTPDQKIPLAETQTAMINLRSVNSPFMVAGTSAPKPPTPLWTLIATQATSLSQQIMVQPSDIDPDGKFHVRFKGAAVLENPNHTAVQQPFVAVQLNNNSTIRNGSNPLFFQWIYSNEPGIPYGSLAGGAGTNTGSNTRYLYSQVRGFDIAQEDAFVQVGDLIELVVIASGCSLGGHDGHFYLDDVQTGIPAGLWISTTGPASATPGQTITYTYTYINNQPISDSTGFS